jgi:hypothetical protein
MTQCGVLLEVSIGHAVQFMLRVATPVVLILSPSPCNVASPFIGKDENDVEGTFFPFPDLSCRTTGTYILKFSLVILDPLNMRHSKVPVRYTTASDAFHVYNAKDFIGMQLSTELIKC